MSSSHRKVINWAAIGIGVTVLFTLASWATRSLGAAYTVGKSTTQRDAKIEKLESEVKSLKDTDAAVMSELRQYMRESSLKLDQIIEKTSRVQGAFEQHVYQGRRDPLDH